MLPRTTPLSIIPNRGEFIDALRCLRRGHVMVRISDVSGGCVIDGCVVYQAPETLLRYGLVQEFDNPRGFAHAHYFRLSERGREFADRAVQAWRAWPLWQRLVIRLLG